MRQVLYAFCLLMGAVAPVMAQNKNGEALYITHCIACHQVEAVGAPGIAPPLANNIGRHAASEAGRAYLASVMLTGMVGSIQVGGVRYSGSMPSFAKLSDTEMVDVLSQVLGRYEGVTDLSWLTSDFVALNRRLGGTPNETHKKRSRLLSAMGG